MVEGIYGTLEQPLRDAIRADDARAVAAVCQAIERDGRSLNHVAMFPLLQFAYAQRADAALLELLRRGAPKGAMLRALTHHVGEHSVSSAAMKDGRFELAVELLEIGVTLTGVTQRSEELDGLAVAIARRGSMPHGALRLLLKGHMSSRDRAIFLYRAQSEGNRTLAMWLLTSGVPPDGPTKPNGVHAAAHLILAARRGDEEMVRALLDRRARAGATDGEGLDAVRHVLLDEDLASDVRARLVEQLIRAGAVPETLDRQKRSAYDVAEARGFSDLSTTMRAIAAESGPRYAREARQRGISDIRVFYDKAMGLVFSIGESVPTFYVGGDYDGAWRVDAHASGFDRLVLGELARIVEAHPDVAWFEPFAKRVVEGEDFSLAEFLERCPQRCVVGFDASTNWR